MTHQSNPKSQDLNTNPIKEKTTERIQLLLTPSQVRMLDDLMFNHRFRSRAAVIRHLIEAASEDR